MRKMRKIIACLLCIFLFMEIAMSQVSGIEKEETRINYEVTEKDGMIVNPHKGWITYPCYAPEYDGTQYGFKKAKTWSFSGTAYERFYWSDIQVNSKKYNFECIDNSIRECRKYGKTFAFGVIPSNSSRENKKGFVPEYVYKMGCKYVLADVSECYEDGKKHVQRTPVWSDSIYLKEMKKLIYQLAKRYDGNKTIEYIDLRSFGNWGEWHTYYLEGSKMPSKKVQKKCLDWWSDAFKMTRLVLPVNGSEPDEISKYAVSKGITLRRDGLITLENDHRAVQIAAKKDLPTVGEFCLPYEDLKQCGDWKDELLIRCVEEGKFTYLSLGQSVFDGIKFYKEKKDLIEKVQNLLGYHLVVKEACLKQEQGGFLLELQIENKGVAIPDFPIYLSAYRLEEDGKIGEKLATTKESISKKVRSKETTTITLEWKNKDQMEQYQEIAFGLFEQKDAKKPTVFLANNENEKDGYMRVKKYTKR